jgi:hypothetical protein
MTRDELHQEFMEDDTQYCCYCGSERGPNLGAVVKTTGKHTPRWTWSIRKNF